MIGLTEFLVNAGYLLMLAAFLVRDILWLRTILIFAQSSLALYGLFIDRLPMVYWNGLFVVINTLWVIKIIRERRPVRIPPELDDLYQSLFSVMTPREFLEFWGRGAARDLAGQPVIREGESQRELFLILDGGAGVMKGNSELARLGRGAFIGEMSFLTGQPASADVKGNNTLRVMVWDQSDLRQWKSRRPQIFMKLQGVLGSDLVEKIRAANYTIHGLETAT
jgi:hypothetical protein